MQKKTFLNLPSPHSWSNEVKWFGFFSLPYIEQILDRLIGCLRPALNIFIPNPRLVLALFWFALALKSHHSRQVSHQTAQALV